MTNNIPTPHISAKEGEIAPSILLPADYKEISFVCLRPDGCLVPAFTGISPFLSWEPVWAAHPWASIPTS